MAIAGVTVAAAVSVGGSVAAAWPAVSAPGAAFAHYGASLDASQRSLTARAATAAVRDNSLWPDHLGTWANVKQAHQEALAAQLAAARRRAAARAAARRAAAARAAARRAAAQAAQTTAQAASAPSGSPQQIAQGMLASFGWSASEFSCLDSLWGHESGWSVTASNPSSGAYGIPQALPGSKMASAGADWQTSAATQIKWGLGYIQSTYGSPCAAWSHEESAGWY
ncbi:MAG: lytic transglycosylase domain-containing protein [Gemmatimonadota bacterium]